MNHINHDIAMVTSRIVMGLVYKNKKVVYL